MEHGGNALAGSQRGTINHPHRLNIVWAEQTGQALVTSRRIIDVVVKSEREIQ